MLGLEGDSPSKIPATAAPPKRDPSVPSVFVLFTPAHPARLHTRIRAYLSIIELGDARKRGWHDGDRDAVGACMGRLRTRRAPTSERRRRELIDAEILRLLEA